MKLRLLSLIVVMAISFGAKAQIITTVAGNGIQGYNGDSIVATTAELNGLSAIVADKYGNIYIAEAFSNRIRKVNINGIISTVAGNGTRGFSGDGGVATLAQLSSPSELVFDTLGNLYFSDEYNHVIRKIDTNSIITTIAGNGMSGFNGDSVAATSATLYYPRGIVIDNYGNIYISDQFNNRIRKVDSKGIITTVAGNGTAGYSGDGAGATSAQLNYPNGVTLDIFSNLYISDNGNNVIRKITPNGIISTIAGNGSGGFNGDGGAATSAELNIPIGVAIDKYGNIFIADYFNNRIRKVNTKGIISTVVGNGIYGFSGDGGAADSAELNDPEGISIDAYGNLYIPDALNFRVRKVTGLVTPLILNSFNAAKQENNVLLSWQTATEVYSSHFNIQRSIDAKDFATIGAVNVKGASTYSFNDQFPPPPKGGILYYRLEVVDKDGSKTYSEIRTVLLTTDDSRFTITPNPARDIVTIAGSNIKQVSILDLYGRTVMTKEMKTNTINLAINNLSKGVYLVKAIHTDGSINTEKLLVE